MDFPATVLRPSPVTARRTVFLLLIFLEGFVYFIATIPNGRLSDSRLDGKTSGERKLTQSRIGSQPLAEAAHSGLILGADGVEVVI